MRVVLTKPEAVWRDDDMPVNTRDDEAGVPPRTLADKIDRLFEIYHPPTRGPYSLEEAAELIAERGGPTLSRQYLWQLRKGKRDNPNMQALAALAAFFEVHPGYFFDDEFAARVDDQLHTRALLSDPGLREVLDVAAGLSPATLAAVRDLLKHIRQLEALPARVIELST